MSSSTLDAHHDIVERVAALANERLAGDAAGGATAFIRAYYERVAAADLASRDPRDLYGAAMSHRRLGEGRRPGEARVRVVNPDVETDGWQSPHSVVDVVTDDMPFLVDSVVLVLNRHTNGIHLVVHPMLQRAPGEPAESWIHVEFDRERDPAVRTAIESEVRSVLADVRAAVEDWPAMHALAVDLAAEIASPSATGPADESADASELLRWMADDHFTFLGYREYDLDVEGGDDVLRAVASSGLGLLREERRRPSTKFFRDLPPEVRVQARQRHWLVVTKANSRSTVHRDDYLEYVAVKKFGPDGAVTGERRFIGLFTAATYRSSAREIPFLRSKIDGVLERSGLPISSHSGRELWNILETYPRDELFQLSVEELGEIAGGILQLQERKQVRLFVRRDDFGRFVSCLVFVPRDRFSTAVVSDIERVLLAAYGGTSAEHDTRISESVLARVHVLVHLGPDAPDQVDTLEVERRLARVTRWWADDLRDSLVAEHGEEHGLDLLDRYLDAFPSSYREGYAPSAALRDLARVEQVLKDGPGSLLTAFYRPVEADADHVRLKLFTVGEPVTLSAVLPVLEQMGVEVVDERPYQVNPVGAPTVWVYDFGLQAPGAADLASGAAAEAFHATFGAVWRGEMENDGFNRLVLTAGLTGRQVTVLRAYARYLRQIGLMFSQSYVETTMAKHAGIARQLVDLFEARLDPSHEGHRTLEMGGITAEITAALDEVTSLDEDRILRAFLRLIEATMRTNAWRTDGNGPGRSVLSFKLDPEKVPDLPLPRPMFEIWVYSPRVEGVHLRGGPVARGGLRWSDRREDFRTEVLGLMKAQMVKNAVIVPVGAKGGFVLKRPPSEPEAMRAEVERCYRAFVSGLLDVTDNIVGGKVVPPPQVVRHDDDDPYLVVAADKGTATFSDTANDVAAQYGFWLGDAFASGGSAGYDHKAMGITARGAWESVRRHFRVLGRDADRDEITVVGVGDMSGDVFGNGLLMSPHLKLLAAFDHRHIFLDPNPDPARSFAERQRLFGLTRSSWDDYDRAVISAGGGVFPRTAKAVPLSDEVRAALDTRAANLTPAELMSLILRASVDLLWNGGIGTYVKATEETDSDAGDRANDALRVNGADLRAVVVGEGGNLGFTQRGRIEAARNGVLLNTDAIDNSAGVDCSDHEVNIKILVDQVVASGDLTAKQRNELLVEMTDDVARLVLEDNVAQNIALAIARTQSGPMVNVHARYLHSLEQEGLVNRELEFLPSDKLLAERQAAGIGLTTPEFAVLLAYTKTTNVHEVVRSDLPDDSYVQREILEYFPPALGARFPDRMAHHRLRREIIATRLVNEMVNRSGISFDYRMTEETGAAVPDIVRAHVAARDIYALDEEWQRVEALDGHIDGAVQIELFLGLRQMVERGVLWILRNRRPPIDLGAVVASFAPGVHEVGAVLPHIVAGAHGVDLSSAAERFSDAGVPDDLAWRAGAWPFHHTTLDVVEIAGARGRTPADAASAYWGLVDRLDLAWLWQRIGALPRHDRWQAHARAALRDDLLGELRHLTDDVLRAGDVFSAVGELIDRWVAANERGVDRIAQVFTDIRNSGTYDLTTLSVALRQLRNLILSSVAAA